MTAPYLGVGRSFSGRSWRARLDGPGEARAQALETLNGVDPALARVLASRGVTPETAAGFLAPRLRDLMPDPSALVDMDRAVDRFVRALERGEAIAIFGDYDVDGACSAALVAEWLDSLGRTARIHIPDRLTEGYGPNVPAIEALRREGADLLICVDCGTAGFEALAAAKRVGLDALVLDHHLAPADLPETAGLVNPNRQDDLSGQGALCAAGVCFLFLAAANRALRARGFFAGDRREPDLMAALDLVALATVADVARLEGLNRAFVVGGLARMRARERIGLAALADSARLDGPPTTYHLGFLLGPRINAGGRIGEAGLGAKLLLERDPLAAARIAAELDALNEARRAIERAAVAEGEAQALARDAKRGAGAFVVVADAGWHPGIVGLVASRLKDKFGRPAFAIALRDDHAVGSGRSIAGFDLGAAVAAASREGVVEKGGGHPMAAGVTLGIGGVEAFRDFLESRFGAAARALEGERALAIDAPLTAGAATLERLREIEKAGPFGQGAPEPVFALAAHRVLDCGIAGEDHVRARIGAGDGASVEAIAFRARGTPLGAALLAARGGAPIHLAGALAVNRWRGSEKAQLRLIDAAPLA